MRIARASLVAAALSLAVGCSTVRALPPENAVASDGQAKHIETDDFMAYTVSTKIDAPPEAVWTVLADVDAYPEWNTTVVSSGGEVEKDGTVTLISTLDPEREFELTVAELEPQKKMVWEDGMPMGLFSGIRTYSLEPTDDGGTVYTMTEVFSGGMLGMIGDSIPDMTQSFETFAADLKKKAEGSTGAASGAAAAATDGEAAEEEAGW